jgi:[ribosomal protein S18]-alanine N-acetyltransferase
MNIRPMTLADTPAVDELDQLCFSQPWPAGSFARELDNPCARCWVAEVDGKLAGALVIWLILDEGHIATIATHPDTRRRGIGRALLQTGMDAAYAEGARIYHLEVRAGNAAAIKMYETFGYEIVGRRPRYYQDNGEDALLMSKVEGQTSVA